MTEDKLKELLTEVQQGKVEVNTALERLKTLPFEDLGFAMVDHHRQLRTGVPEVIFCQGKQPEQIKKIVEQMLKAGSNILATRATEEVFKQIKQLDSRTQYHPLARTITIEQQSRPSLLGELVVLSAGTSDIPVAEEARVTAQILGSRVKTLYDVGVAGIHRLLNQRAILNKARAIVVVAGMEGALASVVAGMVGCPVVAVPTSIGYGASFGGVAALLGMLNSCANGVAVVNIDNGFGAGYMAHKINVIGLEE